MEVVPTEPEVATEQTAAGGTGTQPGGSQQFDVVIVGGGPGGYAAALYGAAAGLSIGLVELDKVGGTCLHRGCVPAKEFLETAAVYRTVRSATDFGIAAGPDQSDPTVKFAVSQERKQQVVNQLFNGLSGLLKGRGVTVFNGSGTLLGDHRVRIAGNDGSTVEVTGTDVVLAAGSVPRTIPGFDIDGTTVLTSDEVLALDRLPGSVAVIGGGAIGCEFASMFSDLGTSVTVFEALPTILNGCDDDVVRTVARSFKKRGIDVMTGVTLNGHTPDPSGRGTVVSYDDGKQLAVDAVVVSVGRRPRTEGLVAPEAGVTIDERGFVVTDAIMRTSAPGVWAVGDVVAGTPQLAHVAFAESIVVIKSILGEPAAAVDYSRVPVGHLLPPGSRLRRPDRGRRQGGRHRRRGQEGPVRRQQSGPDHRRHRGHGEGRRREAPRRLDRPYPGRAHGRTVGDRTARCRLSGRQLGSHGRRGGPVHPAAPVAVRDLRRDGAGTDRKGTARWLT